MRYDRGKEATSGQALMRRYLEQYVMQDYIRGLNLFQKP